MLFSCLIGRKRYNFYILGNTALHLAVMMGRKGNDTISRISHHNQVLIYFFASRVCSSSAGPQCPCQSEKHTRLESSGWSNQLRGPTNKCVPKFLISLSELLIRFQFIISVCSLLRKLKQQARENMDQRRPNLVKALKQMGDFYMEVRCSFYDQFRDNWA